AIPKKEQEAIKKTAKKKASCTGKMSLTEDKELNVLPKGGNPSSLAKGIQIVGRNNNAWGGINGIVIGPEEAEETETEGEESGEIPAAPPPPPTDDGKAFQARLKGFLPKYQQAIQGGSPQVGVMKALYEKVKAAMEANNFTQANTILDKLEPAVASAGERRGHGLANEDDF